MLLVVVVTIGLAVLIAVSVVTRRSAVLPLAVLGGVVLLYGAAIVGVSAASGAQDLRPGDVKCFDEWCASMVSAESDPAARTVAVQVHLENHGRGAQRSVLAGAFIETGRQRLWTRNPDELHLLLPGGGGVNVRLLFEVPGRLASARFVITEAASGQLTPGAIVIGDEASPFHGSAGWPVGSG